MAFCLDALAALAAGAIAVTVTWIGNRRQSEGLDRRIGAGAPQAQAGAASAKADEVLREHHRLLRRLFEKIEATSRKAPQRGDLMRALAAELEIHEHVEEQLFYPAARAICEGVPPAGTEHRRTAELMTATLKFNTTGAKFDEYLQALRAAFEHHAGQKNVRCSSRCNGWAGCASARSETRSRPCWRNSGHRVSGAPSWR